MRPNCPSEKYACLFVPWSSPPAWMVKVRRERFAWLDVLLRPSQTANIRSEGLIQRSHCSSNWIVCESCRPNRRFPFQKAIGIDSQRDGNAAWWCSTASFDKFEERAFGQSAAFENEIWFDFSSADPLSASMYMDWTCPPTSDVIIVPWPFCSCFWFLKA